MRHDLDENWRVTERVTDRDRRTFDARLRGLAYFLVAAVLVAIAWKAQGW